MVSIQKLGKKQWFKSEEAENYVHGQDHEFFNCSSDSDSEVMDNSTPPLALHNENQNSASIFWRPWNGTRRLFRCRSCNFEKTFKRSPELRRHMRTTHMSHIERCTVCFQEFTRKDNLTRHMKTKHNTKVKPSCKFCFKQLSRKDAVHRHESTCHLNAEFSPRISSCETSEHSMETIDTCSAS